MRAGAHKTRITPDSEVFLSGFPRGRRSTGVHDDLWVRCVSLSDGVNTLSLATVDLAGLLREDVEEIAGGLNPGTNEHLLVCATDVHSAPDTLGIFGANSRQSSVDETYIERIRSDAIDCINRSRSNMREATIKLASFSNPLRIENFRDPGLVDKGATALYVVDTRGKVISSIASFASAPVLSDAGNSLISSDWLNTYYSRIEERLGGIGIFVKGASGGSLSQVVTVRSFDEAARVGRLAADAVIAPYAQARRMGSPTMSVRETGVKVPMENVMLQALCVMGVMRGNVGKSRSTTVAIARLGPLTISALPGEVFPEVNFVIKDRMKTPYKIVASLVNDWVGYIVPSPKFDPSRYEERLSLGRQTSDILLSALGALLDSEPKQEPPTA